MLGFVRSYLTEIAVRYAETDRMGVAHHSSYLLWFELGRTGLLREAGFPYLELEKRGFLLPVIEYSCKLSAGAGYDDVVGIEVTVEELKSRTVTFFYRAQKSGDLIATAKTKHLCVDRGNNFRRIPPDVARALSPYVHA